jgi:hypothetical protein
MAVENRTGPRLDVIPKPWTYNPSSWQQRVPICLYAATAFVIAVYLALYQWRLIDHVWDPVWGDQTMQVLDSDVSHQMHEWFLIPDGALGALAYLVDLVLALAGSTRRWQFRPWLVLLFGFAIIPLGIVSVTLVALQGTVVGSWCFLCIVTAILSLLLIYWSYDEVWTSIEYLYRVRKRTRDWRIVWDTLSGRPSPAAAEVAGEMIRS